MWRSPSGKQQVDRDESLGHRHPSSRTGGSGSSTAILRDVRRRLAELLKNATGSYERNKKDASRLIGGVKHRVAITMRGFSGSADTWPPVVRKPKDRSS
jgi:hypothetical protein